MLKNAARSLVAASFLACPPAIALADDDGGSRVVDCSRDRSIQDVLDKRNSARPLALIVRGACAGDVEITRDDVELRGEGGASITGAVRIVGARRAVVAQLSIRNPAGDAILVADGASATIENNTISDSAGYGIFVRNASLAFVNDNQLLGNGVVNSTNIDASGIGVTTGSTVRAQRNQIADNANTGIEIFDNSAYRSEGDSISMRPAGPAGRSAVDVFRAGYVELRNVTVGGRVFVNQQSQLQVRNVGSGQSVINGIIDVNVLSFLRLRAGVMRNPPVLGSCGGFSICNCDTATGGAPCPVPTP